jgi:hypothetical protein
MVRPGTDVPQILSSTPPFAPGPAVLLPGGDYRLAVVRTGPSIRQSDGMLVPGQDIYCSEPSPDWAIALGTAIAGAASGRAPGGPSGSVSGSASTTEAITALAGRTAGVVSLRDGLYAACEAYANQAIGKDAYTFILSQYGNVLATLASGPSGGGASTASPSTSTTPSGTPPSSNAPQGESPLVHVMQLQALQAIVLACLSYYDQSIPHSPNNLLQENCAGFFREFAMRFRTFLSRPKRPTNPQANQQPARPQLG